MNKSSRLAVSGVTLVLWLAVAGCAGTGAGSSAPGPKPLVNTTMNAVFGYVVAVDPGGKEVRTNIPKVLLDKLAPAPVPGDRLEVTVTRGSPESLKILERSSDQAGPPGETVYSETVTYAAQAGGVPPGQNYLYPNGGGLVLANGVGGFVEKHKIGSGPAWVVEVRRVFERR